MRARVVYDDTGHARRLKVVRSACGKLAYASRKLALASAAVQSKATGETIRAYKCTRGCHAWHLGHPPGTKVLRAAARYLEEHGGES